MADKFIEAGWLRYRAVCIRAEASPGQLDAVRMAYYAGAAILFETLMRVLDPGEEPTDADLAKMGAIDAELREYGQELDARMIPKPRGGH